MCTAYEIGQMEFDVDWLVADAFEASMFEEGAYQIIRPTLKAPVIMPNGRLRVMSWGFRRPVPGGKTKQLWRTIVNSREDKLGGRMWSKAFIERRCVIPASAFFEWVTGPAGKALPLRFTRPGGKGILIAGIWEEDQERGECFSMITTEPSAAIKAVHDRMPAVLSNHQLRPFIEGGLIEFGPSTVSLEWAEAENFLIKAKDPPSTQGELF
jgi:putative SOS response-associated peptidase YedK